MVKYMNAEALVSARWEAKWSATWSAVSWGAAGSTRGGAGGLRQAGGRSGAGWDPVPWPWSSTSIPSIQTSAGMAIVPPSVSVGLGDSEQACHFPMISGDTVAMKVG